MTPDEIQAIIDTAPTWEKIKDRHFYRALVSKTTLKISKLKCQWVRKIPISAEDIFNSEINFRKWNKINPKFPAYQSLEGYLFPYFEQTQAEDNKIANKVIEIYRETRFIVLDAGEKLHFLEHHGETQCAYVDQAYERDSPVNDEQGLHQRTISKTLKYLDEITHSGMIATASAIRTLIKIEFDLRREEIKDEYITPEFMAKLHILSMQGVKFTPKLMERLLYLLSIDIDNMVPDSELNNFLQIPRNLFILQAVKLGLTTIVGRIIKHNPSYIDEKDYFGRTPLIIAVLAGHRRMLEYLIMLGANVFGEQIYHSSYTGNKTSQNWTALNFAIDHDHSAAICILINAMLNPLKICSSGLREKLVFSPKLINQLTILHESRKILNADTGQRLLALNQFDEANEIKDHMLMEFYNARCVKDYQVPFFNLAAKYALNSMLKKLVVENPELIKLNYKEALLVAKANRSLAAVEFIEAECAKLRVGCQPSNATLARSSFFFPSPVYAYAIGAVAVVGIGITLTLK